jgi:glycosyltransferase involved in cell wall biosynthesis
MLNARLTVVTITFNDHEGLMQTSQSLDDSQVEWIVIDGSNSDLTKTQNIELLKHRKVLHIQEPDEGRFNAMNKGLSLSTGNLVCFMNSGDRFANIDVPYKIINSWNEKKWVWAVGNTIAIDEDGKHQWKWPMPRHKSLKLRIGVNSYCHQSTVYEASALKKLNGFFEQSLYSDWLTSLLLSTRIKPYISDDTWAFFLTNGISSQQSLEYWSRESIRLRKIGNVKIGRIFLIDFLIQVSCKAFLQTKRGRLIRPDLSRKYPV